jgi:hypothetical protein
VDIEQATVENLTSGKSLKGNPPSAFLLEMLQTGGLIPLLKSSNPIVGQDGILRRVGNPPT